MTESRSGYLYGIGAYLAWGFFPLYWPLLDPASSLEVLAHRFVWSLAFCLALVWAGKLWSPFWRILRSARLMFVMALATAFISVNWGVFIWAVTHGHVLETSLGYFINPLITVGLGVVVLRENLTRLQWAAIAIAAIAVVVLTINHGRPPWIALALAMSFASYGFLKKKVNLGAIEALAIETLIAFPVALAYLLWLKSQAQLTFGTAGAMNVALLIGTGLVTAGPLLLFGAAATRLRLSTIGLLQYIGPIVQFILGLTVFGEHMSGIRWFGFVMVWTALCLFTWDALRRRNKEPA